NKRSGVRGKALQIFKIKKNNFLTNYNCLGIYWNNFILSTASRCTFPHGIVYSYQMSTIRAADCLLFKK
ncbi:hypothetical protein, partial [uncultured Brachyspira sp.]|uniref:hypothetical protein n=1 Tax=uncultured Brachyspira sp. TaxID=221953 RepID=UPI0026287B80